MYTVELGYNDIGLCDTPSITSDILWFDFLPLVVILCSSVITTLVYNDAEYSVPFVTL